VGITRSCRLRCPSKSGGRQGEQGGLSQQVPQRDEGVDAQARLWGCTHLSAGERIEHPRGDSNLEPVWEFDDDTIRSLASQPPQNFSGLPTEGMLWRTDLGYRRMMSSVTMSVATVSPPIFWRTATISVRCRNSWDTRTCVPPWSLPMCCNVEDVGSTAPLTRAEEATQAARRYDTLPLI